MRSMFGKAQARPLELPGRNPLRPSLVNVTMATLAREYFNLEKSL
jgi:hypothetical protein